MKNIKAMVFALLLVLMSPAAFALVWQDPYWLPVGTSDPDTVAFGSTATAASGAFSSIDTSVHYRAELRRVDGALVSVLEEHNVDISVFTGYETVEIPLSAYSAAGEYWVRFTISDSHETENKQLRLVVSPGDANHPPVLNTIADRTVYENSLLTFTVSGSDHDSDSITFSADNLPSGATFNSATRTFRWTPNFDQAGVHEVTFVITDEHGATDSQVVRITVLDVNRCPVINPIGLRTVSEGQLFTFAILASDADGTALSYSASGLPAGAVFNAATRTFSWIPTYSQSGIYFVTFKVTDGACVDTETVRIIVTDDSSPIVTLTAVPSEGSEGVNVSFICTAVGGDAPLSYIITFGDDDSVPSNRASHVYPIEGAYVAVCTVTDNDGDVGSDSVEVMVGDDAPVVNLVATPVSGESPLEVDFICNITGGNAPFIHVIDFGDGEFANTTSATHVYDSEGLYVATCTVVDNDGDMGSDTVGIDVSSNACPVLAPLGNQTVQVGATLAFTVSASDADGGAVVYSADAPFAAFIDPMTGFFSWSPVELQVGDHLATFRATDGKCEDSQVIHIIVTSQGVNHAPDAEFNWTPGAPEVGDSVRFTSTSTDPEGDALTCAWDFDADGFTDSIACVADYVFTAPGEHAVTLTVSDGSLSDSVTHIITVFGQLNVTGISCFSPVIEDNLQSCSVHVESGGVSVGGANAVLHYIDGTVISNCVTDSLTGTCRVTFAVGPVGNYTVYATAQKPGWLPDLDSVPTASFEVLAQRYLISNLAVYNDSGFTNEDVEFFRGDDMYVHFMVIDEITGMPVDGMITSVALVSPPGGVAWFSEYPHAHSAGNYWYSLEIPITHDFLGDSQVFTFAFNFTDRSGVQMVVEVTIMNNPPVIVGAIADEFNRTFNETTAISLTPYESDVEDSGAALVWSVLGVDSRVAEVSVDRNDLLTIRPVSEGYDIITLVLRDLDGDTDSIDVPINTGAVVELPQCADGIDNDGDGLVDLADPGCLTPEDDDETNTVHTPQCSDSVDNDGDGLIDLADPGCEDSDDDDETDAVVEPQCNDGIDNDADGLVDMVDPGCASPGDNDETDPVLHPECSDGLDNDGDGLIDMADPDCSAPDDNSEEHVAACADGVDNDGDGLIDLTDPGCTNSADDDEFDIAGNQPPIADLRLSRDFGAPSMIVAVDGSHSYDPDGSVVEHSWIIVGPGNYTYENLHVAGAPSVFAVQFNNIGIYEVRLTVVDNLGASDTEIKTVSIGNYPQCNNGLDDDGDGKIDWPADLHCYDRNDPYEGEIFIPIAPKVFRDQDTLLINRIDLNGYDVESAVAAQGSELKLGIALRNNLDVDMNDIKVDISIYELGVKATDTLRNLDGGDTSTVTLNLELPEYVEPGLYDLRIVVSNDDVRRVKYRTIAIV